MQNFLDKLRGYDYSGYQFLHDAIVGRPWLNATYLFFAKYGIVLFFLSFIYLIHKKKVLPLISSFVAVSIVAVIDALIVLDWKRPRPFISHSTQVLMPIISGLRVTRVSFPSVHAYVVFAIATSVYLYGHRKLGTVLYGLAILVAIGRVGAGLHYPSDVIAGALLGIGSAILAFLIVQKAEPNWR